MGRTTGALCFAAAEFVGDREVGRQPWLAWVLGGSLTYTLLIAAGVMVSADVLPQGVGAVIDLRVDAAGSLPDILIHPFVTAAQLVMAVAFLAGAAGFARRQDVESDPLLPWLPAAGVLAAFARLHYFLLPSLHSDVVYSGDILRVGFYALLLTAVMAELRATWQALADTSAMDERRRIARDLHDGLAQELAFITTQSTWLVKRYPDEARTELLASSARRALDESRRAIRTLNNVEPSTLADALVEAAEDVASRHEQQVRFDVDYTVDVAPPIRGELVRIACEAVGNAARHGGPDQILLRLTGGLDLRMEIVDDGRGFAIDAQGDTTLRFGLRTMRERAEAFGGTLEVESVPGDGTTIRVVMPWQT